MRAIPVVVAKWLGRSHGQLHAVLCAGREFESHRRLVTLPSPPPVCWWLLYDTDWDNANKLGQYNKSLINQQIVN